MAKGINTFSRRTPVDPKDLLVVLPCTAGSSTTDPTLNTYGDADCAFAGDLGGSATPSASITASEDLAAGDLVNIWDNGGTANIRKANATDATKPAHGYVTAAVTSGSAGAVFFSGTINAHRSALTPGTVYWLDVTGGSVASAAPSSSGNLVQQIGVAISATQLVFQPTVGVQL